MVLRELTADSITQHKLNGGNIHVPNGLWIIGLLT